MEIYLVGGAVRDELLGLTVRERDWVVVGATPEALVSLGYTQVGRDFPVFLHPVTHEEYALARTERKTGPGYHGFTVRYSPDVTLAEDLRRRDLTINSIARDGGGKLIDPYGGVADLNARVLRHVSEAFTEDPVRILRLARFAARFAPLGFSVAPETATLLAQMVQSGEADALVPERVWAETAKALAAARPSVYFTTLASCGALDRVFPELGDLATSADAFAAAMAGLDRAASAGATPAVRFATLLVALPGVEAVESLCARGRVPTDYRDIAIGARRAAVRVAAGLSGADALLSLLESVDAFRRPERFLDSILALGFHVTDGAQSLMDRLALAQRVAGDVQLEPGELSTLRGREIGERLRERRRTALAALF